MVGLLLQFSFVWICFVIVLVFYGWLQLAGLWLAYSLVDGDGLRWVWVIWFLYADDFVNRLIRLFLWWVSWVLGYCVNV